MSIAAQFTIEQYKRMIDAGVFDDRDGRRIELFRGEVVDMSPIGDRHAWIVQQLDALSHELLRGKDALIRVHAPIVLPELASRPEPDLVWASPADYRNRSPRANEVLLLIEVADTTWMYDSHEKADLYAEAGIADYWLVNVSDNYVVVHREPTAKGYRTREQHRGQDELRPLAFPKLVVRPDDFLDKR